MTERDDHIAELIEKNYPLPSIAAIVGLPDDYCKTEIRRVAHERGLQYDARKTRQDINPYGLTKETHRFRHRLGDHLYDLCNEHSRLEVSAATGLFNKQQNAAKERPFMHDWRLSNIERMADFMGLSFRQMLLRCEFTEDELEAIPEWVKNK